MRIGPPLSFSVAGVAALFLLACDGGTGAKSVPSGTGNPNSTGQNDETSLSLPGTGQLYHGVFPAGFASAEHDTDISLSNLHDYEETVGRPAALVALDNNWFQQRAFPSTTASQIRALGAVPYVRLMMRSSMEQNVAEPTFTLDRIITGDFDADLSTWGDAAVQFATPLVVEFGTEVNGDWFSWSPTRNGGGLEQGAAKFRSAYRHIVETVRSRGAKNILWAFHAADASFPSDPRNSMAALYPGDDVVDWVGLSVYGQINPLSTECRSFASKVDAALPELSAAAPGKPVFILEFGTVGNAAGCDAGKWVGDAVADMLGGRWPSLKGFFWWNERWSNDKNPAHDSNMALQQIPAMGDVFRRELNGNQGVAVADHPVLKAHGKRDEKGLAVLQP